ncbi:hypothetical protein C8R44DRAFT_873881 [Mycena epipterygia]|nr:hypothetical protein C8R44DRAFT_873881 [Mycena epipterygia]
MNAAPTDIDLWSAPLDDVYAHLQCDSDNSLTAEEAAHRLERFGPNLNVFPAHNPKRQSIIIQFLSFLWNPVCWMLEVCAVGLTALGYWGLRGAPESNFKVRVRRAGLWSDIDVAKLVPGDIISLGKENAVPADCRVTEDSGLYVEDEKDNRKRAATPSQRARLFPAGSPLFHPVWIPGILSQIVAFCLAMITVFLVAEVLVLYAGFHYKYRRGIDAIFVLLIGGIPIALPTVVSVVLSVGVEQLARHKTIVTRVAAVEELARVTVLCIERTGVLTEEKSALDDVKAYGSFTADEGLPTIEAKGMTGHIVQMCTRNLTPAVEDSLEADVEDLARRGMSAMALAYEELEGDDPEADGNGFELSGLLGLPLRPNTEQAVSEVILMNVQIKMITDCQLAIARETARRAGLGSKIFPARVFRHEGPLVQQYATLDALILDADGFAGYFPVHRQELLQRLRHIGHFCAIISNRIKDQSSFSTADGITIGQSNSPVPADLTATQPGLSTVVNAIRDPSDLPAFTRLFYLFMCTHRSNRGVFRSPRVHFQARFPPFIIFLVALTTNITTLALDVDRAVLGAKPGRWDLTEIFSYSTAYGLYLTLSTTIFIPSQPQHDNQLRMLIYLQVALISHALIFIVRSEHFFFCRRPSTALLGTFCIAQVSASIISAYGNWGFAEIHAVSAGWIGLVWVWNIIWFISLDLIKFGVYYALGTRNLDLLNDAPL